MILLLPAISVIIPIYNAEKYISKCLESILNQTFQDFEVIAVDDCSTDKSVNIVEKFSSKFNGRFHLIKLKKNSGGPALPRNIAINFSRGEYIANIDNDDLFTKTALEEFYSVAKNMQADVVHAEKYYLMKNSESDLKIESPEKVKPVDKPSFETKNILERVLNFCKGAYWGYPWTKFCRRDFLIENNIYFPQTMPARDDIMFCFQCLCLAENYVRVPNIVNIYRFQDASQSRSKQIILDKHMNKWLKDMIEGVKFLDKFMNSVEILLKRPDLRYAVIDRFIQEGLDWYMRGIYNQVPPHALDDILKKFFSQSKDDSAFMSYIFNSMNVYRNNLIRSQQQKK